MVEIVLSLTQAEYEAMRKIAQDRHMSVTEYVSAMKETLFQIHLPQNKDVSPFEHWEGFGIFNSGQQDTGERVDDLLNAEWKPD